MLSLLLRDRKNLCRKIKNFLFFVLFLISINYSVAFTQELPFEEKPEPENIYCFNDSNVLVYGLQQAQALTNTASFEGFPQDIESRIQSIKLPNNVERSMHQAVLISHLLDAEQVKSYETKPLFAHKNLFKHKLPREWGITDSRKK